MIFPGNIFASFVIWILEKFGLEFALPDERIVEPLDENEIFEQLRHGRD